MRCSLNGYTKEVVVGYEYFKDGQLWYAFLQTESLPMPKNSLIQPTNKAQCRLSLRTALSPYNDHNNELPINMEWVGPD